MGNNSNTTDWNNDNSNWGNNGVDWNQPQGNNADWNQPQGNDGVDWNQPHGNWNQPQGNWNNNAPDWNSNQGQNWNNPNQNWGNSNQNWNNPNQGNPMPNQNWGNSQQAPQPPKKKKHTILYLLLAVVVLIIILGVANSGKSDKITHSSKTSSTSQSESSKSDSSKKGNKKELAIGDSFEQSNMKMTLDNVQFDWQVPSTGDEFEDSMNKPKDGYTYVKMDVTMENTGDKDEFASFTDFKLYADNNPYDQEWGLKEFGVNPNGSDFSELSAGRKASFSVFWQVPANATSVEVEYEPSFWSNEKILIKVK